MIIVFDTVSRKERRPDSQAGGLNTKQGQNQVDWKAVRRNPVPHNPEAIKALANAMYTRRVSEAPLQYRGYMKMWCSFWRDMIVEALNGNSVAKTRIMKDEWIWRALNSMIGMNGDYIRKIMLDYYELRG